MIGTPGEFTHEQCEELLRKCTRSQYCDNLRDCWIGLRRTVVKDQQFWLDAFTACRDDQAKLMTEGERAVLAALPEPAILYRGVEDRSYARGMSWTDDLDHAIVFSGSGGVILESSVSSQFILAYFLDEHEVVIDPQGIIDPKEYAISAEEKERRATELKQRKINEGTANDASLREKYKIKE